MLNSGIPAGKHGVKERRRSLRKQKGMVMFIIACHNATNVHNMQSTPAQAKLLVESSLDHLHLKVCGKLSLLGKQGNNYYDKPAQGPLGKVFSQSYG